MPTVPYNPVPQVAPSQQATPNIDVPTPIAAFGGTIASAIDSVGRASQDAGNENLRRAVALQELQNETEAREADAEYTISMGQLRADYHALEGKNAVQAYPKFVRDVRELQQRYSGTMSNPMSKRIF